MTRRNLTITERPVADPNDTERISERSDGRFRKLFYKYPDPIVDIQIVEERPIIVSHNSQFEARFDVQSDIIGTAVTDCIDAASTKAETGRILDALSQGEQTEMVVDRSAAAPTETLHCRIIPYDESGAERAFLIFTDAAEGQTEKIELRSRNQELEELTSILTHDLRNPINAASGWLDEVDADGKPVERVGRSLKRIERMIDKTLTLTQKPEIIEDTEVVVVRELARKCWQTVDTEDAELVVDDDFNVLCDKDKLARLLTNLFQNAVTHNEGSVTIRIGIYNRMATSTRGSGEPSEAFYISDNGEGIPRDKREDLLEYRKTSKDQGTGLGLTIVQRIAEAHGWELKITETFNGGAKFIFSNATLHGRIPTDS
ncbi:MAG: histidine kinase [uncultured archaeon A07HN63]|nr:MAG: histidine kinase [uncultured archaeon A07HN63]